jgi:hypothetical protein
MLLMVILGAVALSITQLTNYIKALTIKKDFDLSKLRTMDASIDTKQFKAKELVVLQKKAYLEFINYRLKREIIQGYFIVRFFKSHSPDDIAFLMQKIRERVIPTLSINTSK